MPKKTEGRVAYADLLRALAVIGAILHRMAQSQMTAVAVGSAPWNVFHLYSSLTIWCAPVFVMLSGMFLLDPKRGYPLGKLFFHNILRLVVALAFWGGVYAMVEYLLSGGAFTWQGLGSAIWGALRGNTRSHLSFLYLIIGLYLVTPILRAFCRGASRGDLHYFLLLWFLIVSLLPLAFRVWPGYTAGLKTWYDRLQIKLVLGYVGYYVAGHYLRQHVLSTIAEAVIYVLGIAGALCAVWGSAFLPSEAVADPFFPGTVAFSVAVVVLFQYVLGVSDERSRRQRLSRTAQLVLGIWVVHDFFFLLLGAFHITTLTFPAVFSVPALTAAVFLCSFAVAWLISRIPFVGKHLT